MYWWGNKKPTTSAPKRQPTALHLPPATVSGSGHRTQEDFYSVVSSEDSWPNDWLLCTSRPPKFLRTVFNGSILGRKHHLTWNFTNLSLVQLKVHQLKVKKPFAKLPNLATAQETAPWPPLERPLLEHLRPPSAKVGLFVSFLCPKKAPGERLTP